MERYIHDDRTGLDYELVGDCYLIAGEDLGFYRKPEKKPYFDYDAIRRQKHMV